MYTWCEIRISYVTYCTIMYKAGFKSSALPGREYIWNSLLLMYIIPVLQHYLGKVWSLNENPAVPICIPFIREVFIRLMHTSCIKYPTQKKCSKVRAYTGTLVY